MSLDDETINKLLSLIQWFIAERIPISENEMVILKLSPDGILKLIKTMATGRDVVSRKGIFSQLIIVAAYKSIYAAQIMRYT